MFLDKDIQDKFPWFFFCLLLFLLGVKGEFDVGAIVVTAQYDTVAAMSQKALMGIYIIFGILGMVFWWKGKKNSNSNSNSNNKTAKG